MPAHPSIPPRADQLRPLHAPRPVPVAADQRGRPVAVGLAASRSPIRVTEVLDRWRIDDEWWRKEISRLYYHLALENGRLITLFQDLIDGGWFIQTTATPRRQAEPVHVLAPRVTTIPPAVAATPIRETPPPIRRIGVA